MPPEELIKQRPRELRDLQIHMPIHALTHDLPPFQYETLLTEVDRGRKGGSGVRTQGFALAGCWQPMAATRAKGGQTAALTAALGA